MKMCNFFLFSLNIFYSFSTVAALQKLQKLLTCFPKDKISQIYPDLQIQKVFTPRLNSLRYLSNYSHVHIII